MQRLSSTLRRTIIVREPSFGLLWTSQLLSGAGTWLLVVAVPVYVFRLTGSARDTGLAFVAEVVPLLAVGPVAGVFADRWARRNVMICADVLRAGAVAMLLLADRRGLLWLLLLAVGAENACGAFFGPAYTGLVPALTGRGRDLEIANAWSTAASGIVRLAGAPLGGAMYAAGGFRLPVALDTASYLASALLLALIRLPAGSGRPALAPARPSGRTLTADLRAAGADLRAGAAALAADRVLTVLLTASALFLLGNGALTALLIPYLTATLGASAAGIGEIFAALGAGYLLSAYLGRRASATPRLRAAVGTLLAAVVVAFTGLFDVHVFALAVVFAALAGLAGGAFLMLERTLLQRRAPAALIGRISAAYSAVAMGATLAGLLLASLAVTWLGRTAALNLAIAVIAGGVLAASRLPAGSAGPARPRPARLGGA
jgi:predicted MFS family arabinose efflux permease